MNKQEIDILLVEDGLEDAELIGFALRKNSVSRKTLHL
jgi:hypothetical protein